jgi:SAM-dependent methyltransferase
LQDIQYLYLEGDMDLIENGSIVENGNRHPWELARYAIIKKNVKKIISKSGTNLRVIDIGCGDAYVINRLQRELELNCAIGVDINFSEDHLQQLDEKGKLVEYFRSFEEISVSVKDDYLILLNDVLEHIDGDDAFLMAVINQFSKAKSLTFYITVPAFQFVFSQHDIDLLHYRRYTLRGLGALAEKNNLAVKEKGYFFLGLLSIRTGQFLLEKFRTVGGDVERSTIGVNHWGGGGVITRLVTSVLYFDYLILRSFSRLGIHLPGLSAWSIFKLKKQ